MLAFNGVLVYAEAPLDGTLYSGWGDNGTGIVNDGFGIADFSWQQVLDAVALPDGSVVYTGAVKAAGDVPTFIGLAKLTPQGTPDLLFGTAGYARIDIADTVAGAIAIDAQGMLLAGGYQQHNTPFFSSDFIVCRVDPATGSSIPFNGSNQSCVAVPFPLQDPNLIQSALIWQIVPRPDGRTVLAGNASGEGATPCAAFVQLLSDGTLDPQFGEQGKRVYCKPDYVGLHVVAARLTRNGKLVVAGAGTPIGVGLERAELFRLDVHGNVENGWPQNAEALAPPELSTDSQLRDLITLPNPSSSEDDVLALGSGFGDLETQGFTLRLHGDGTFDTAFGNNGRSLHPTVNTYWRHNLAPASDGGFFTAAHTTGFYITQRFRHDGSIDPRFGTNGFQVVNTETIMPNALHAAILPLRDAVVVLAEGSGDNPNAPHRIVAAKLTLDTIFVSSLGD